MHPMLLDIAREFVFQTVYYFSQRETEILRRFFTNTEKRVFFIHTLPANVGAGLIAMYSRIKNTRGLRGVFVDRFLPEFLASTSVVTEEKFGGDPTKALAHFNVVSIETFETNFPGGKELLDQFLNAISVYPDYLEEFAQGEKIKKFLSRWLDQYGHNSIARAGSMWVCYEQISILAAKSVEWGRPGSAYIELSTRYVDMSGKNCYPIEKELRILGVSEELVFNLLDESFKRYRNWQGENFSGPFPQFLRDTYGKYFTEAPKDLESGVIGETCDVLGNFLPAATLTSVGVAISGEAFPELIKHLLLDETPENYALVELTLQEAKKVGGDQFARHYEPSEWKKASWEYLSTDRFAPYRGQVGIISADILPQEAAEEILLDSFRYRKKFAHCQNFAEVLEMLKEVDRQSHDKLWNDFEEITASCSGLMPFRGHRDLQRMSFNMHLRTLLTPYLGFYRYDKPAPKIFLEDCEQFHSLGERAYSEMEQLNVSPILMQYPLALGNLIGFRSSANLLQWEFCNWQRRKFSFNHEVRQVFLGMEERLSHRYRWWGNISRADIVSGYIFARGSKGIPLDALCSS